MKVRYPALKKELLKLEEEDQDEMRGHYQLLQAAGSETEKERLHDRLAKHCHARAHRMLEILAVIKEPTIENIGLEGSKAVSLLALHSYLAVMKQVLALYKRLYKKDPGNIYFQAIPPLADRVMILEYKTQLYGTNWSMDKEGRFFLIQVKDFLSVDRRRAEYGLKPVRRPTVLSIGAAKYPLGKGKAKASDQRELTDEEYNDYAKWHIKCRI